MTYLLKGVIDRREIQAHQTQLHKWNEPPEYLRTHPVYDLCGKSELTGNGRKEE